MTYDYLIVGAGFAGSVCARQLAEAGKRVLIIDKRDHIGGNAYDYVNEDGLRIHKYGPHLFHTNSEKVWDWLSRFTEWTPYEHRVRASLPDGSTVPFPINLDTMDALYAIHDPIGRLKKFNEEFMRVSLQHRTNDAPRAPANAEEQCLASVGAELYEKFFKGYTTKMWGVTPDKLAASVTARIPIRTTHEDRYFTDKRQALPKAGYTAMFERMLDHPNILTVDLGRQVLRPVMPGKHVIWTGPIDEYFNHVLGPLPYRSLKFDHQVWESYPPNYMLPAATVNFPSATMKFTRVTEWAYLQGAPAPRSVLTYEEPCSVGEPFYPMPTPEARALYKQYEALADKEPNVTFLGRLGTYAYLNMDQCVAQALTACERLLNAAKEPAPA